MPVFPNQSWGQETYKHIKFPVYITKEFNFFRCVEFNDNFYGKNMYTLNCGNLRETNINNRYATLFPNQKISYWANSIKTARKEIKSHGASNNIITFWAYDDLTSTFPIIDNEEPLIIVDGRDMEFHTILSKNEKGIELDSEEKHIITELIELKPDCMAYKSVANPGGVNYLFFEKGFNKLSLREISLRLGDNPGKNCNSIFCAGTSDYTPYIKSYGEFFLPYARKGMDNSYLLTQDYKEKCRIEEKSIKRFMKNKSRS